MHYLKSSAAMIATLCILLFSVCGCTNNPNPSSEENSQTGVLSSDTMGTDGISETAGTEEITGSGDIGGTEATGENQGTSNNKTNSSGTVTTEQPPIAVKNFGGREFRYGCSWAPWWSSDTEGIAARTAFEQQYNCKLKYVPLTSDDDYTTLMTSIMAGNLFQFNR